MTACAVAAGACVMLRGSGFTAPSVAAPLPALRSAGSATEEPSAWGFGATATATLGAAAVVASASTLRKRTAMFFNDKPLYTIIQVPETAKTPTVFAGGLVGSKYGGMDLPDYEFDPLELSKCFPEHLPWYREAELKHGRLAMLAFVGFIGQDSFRFPVEPCNDPSITILNAHSKLITGLGQGPMWWLLLVVGVLESIRFKQLGLAFEKLTLQTAGDLDFGKAFLPKTDEGIEQIKTKELKNGRLAMLAVGGIITAAPLHGAHFPWA